MTLISRGRGFSLIEMMVAITISLIILAALSALFVTSSRARSEIQRANEQIENGRFAMQTLGDDLQLAGFLGQLDTSKTLMPDPADKPDPCVAAVTTLDANTDGHQDVLPMHIEGYDNGSGLPSTCDTVLTDRKTNTDVVVIRRASTCVAGTTDCSAVPTANDGTPWFQVSLCANAAELKNFDYRQWYRLVTAPGSLDRHKRDCAATADIRRYYVHIYYVSNNNQGSDGIPTLKRAELGAGPAFNVVPISEGIENLQLEYGVDSLPAADRDGQPDGFTADPDISDGNGTACAAAACRVTNWRDVMAVKINVLARATTQSRDFTDNKTYTLGLKADGTANTVAAPGDHYKRHVFQAVIRLINPAGRRQ